MTPRIDVARLSPQQKADIIYSHAQSAMRDSLWRAALASDDNRTNDLSARAGRLGMDEAPSGLAALLDALGIGKSETSSPLPDGLTEPSAIPAPIAANPAPPATGSLGNLGVNTPYGATLQQAGARTGIPPAALAAIIDAEAAKGKDGAWNPYSRNSRSSAAGLGQFLSGTWIGMAQQPGNWLYTHAREAGWLGENGKVLGTAKSALLALRYDPSASIQTIADYSRANIARLREGGVDIGEDVRSLARAAYVGHHLGPGDAMRFYQGGLSGSRARELLTAQIGSLDAGRRIAASGDATSAHRRWLTSYIDRSVRADRYSTNNAA